MCFRLSHAWTLDVHTAYILKPYLFQFYENGTSSLCTSVAIVDQVGINAEDPNLFFI